eukprot:6181928-Pleurochrysis_carterae.AAC.2
MVADTGSEMVSRSVTTVSTCGAEDGVGMRARVRQCGYMLGWQADSRFVSAWHLRECARACVEVRASA